MTWVRLPLPAQIDSMKINRKFFKTISPVLFELQRRLKGDFVVFGSTPLYLFGVLEFKDHKVFNDLDLVVKDESVIPSEAEVVFFQQDPKQKLYKLKIGDVRVDIGGRWPGREEFFDKIFQDPVIVNNIKFANLDITQEWKELMVKEYGRKKDKDHLKRIKSYRDRVN